MIEPFSRREHALRSSGRKRFKDSEAAAKRAREEPKFGMERHADWRIWEGPAILEALLAGWHTGTIETESLLPAVKLRPHSGGSARAKA